VETNDLAFLDEKYYDINEEAGDAERIQRIIMELFFEYGTEDCSFELLCDQLGNYDKVKTVTKAAFHLYRDMPKEILHADREILKWVVHLNDEGAKICLEIASLYPRTPHGKSQKKLAAHFKNHQATMYDLLALTSESSEQQIIFRRRANFAYIDAAELGEGVDRDFNIFHRYIEALQQGLQLFDLAIGRDGKKSRGLLYLDQFEAFYEEFMLTRKSFRGYLEKLVKLGDSSKLYANHLQFCYEYLECANSVYTFINDAYRNHFKKAKWIQQSKDTREFVTVIEDLFLGYILFSATISNINNKPDQSKIGEYIKTVYKQMFAYSRALNETGPSHGFYGSDNAVSFVNEIIPRIRDFERNIRNTFEYESEERVSDVMNNLEKMQDLVIERMEIYKRGDMAEEKKKSKRNKKRRKKRRK